MLAVTREEQDTEQSLKLISGKIAKRLRIRSAEIATAIEKGIRKSVPDSVSHNDAAYQSGVTDAVIAILDYCLDAIENDVEQARSIPPQAIAQAHRAARAGVSMGTVLRRYVAGHGRLSEFVAEEAEHLGLSSNGLALNHLRRAQEALLEHLTASIEYEYLEGRAQMSRASGDRRMEIVQRLLAQQRVDPAELIEFDYELDTSWHVSVVATGATIRDVLPRMRAKLRCRLLHVACDDGTIWAWFGAPYELKPCDIERTVPPQWDGEVIAIGGARRGLEGWRQTHLEAKAARLRALRRPDRIVRYDERPLLAAALENETLATWLMDFLAPIQARQDAAELLRTLRAYLDSECNCSSAVPVVKVRRQTVGNRIRLVERLLDRPLRTCLAELDVALRLADLRSAD